MGGATPDILRLIHWDTVVTGLMSASIIWLIRRGERKRDEARAEIDAKRDADTEWRDRMDAIMNEYGSSLRAIAEDRDGWYEWRAQMESRLDEQDSKIDAVLAAQCTQMRSDITHKIHRYMDDLGCASMEEKESLNSEYEVYCEVCNKYGIENHFVERLMEQVMTLPDRS